MSWVSDTQGKQPAGTSEKRLLIFWEQMESVSTSSPRCSCESNEKHHSQKEKLPVTVKCLQLLIGHLLVSAALIGKWWLSSGRLPLFHIVQLDTHKHESHPHRRWAKALNLKETWMFSLASAISCQIGEKPGRQWERACPPEHNPNHSVCLLTEMSRSFHTHSLTRW